MPADSKFKKNYIDFVVDVSLARGGVSNRIISQRLGVAESTIRNWRKEYRDFDRAFIESLNCLREEMNTTARQNLKPRKRKIVKQTAEGESVITEDVLPTHNDLAVLTKLGVSASVVEEKNEERAFLRNTLQRKIAGELTALEAAQILESEGISVPKTVLLEVQKEFGGVSGEDFINMANNLGQLMNEASQRVKVHAAKKE